MVLFGDKTALTLARVIVFISVINAMCFTYSVVNVFLRVATVVQQTAPYATTISACDVCQQNNDAIIKRKLYVELEGFCTGQTNFSEVTDYCHIRAGCEDKCSHDTTEGFDNRVYAYLDAHCKGNQSFMDQMKAASQYCDRECFYCKKGITELVYNKFKSLNNDDLCSGKIRVSSCREMKTMCSNVCNRRSFLVDFNKNYMNAFYIACHTTATSGMAKKLNADLESCRALL